MADLSQKNTVGGEHDRIARLLDEEPTPGMKLAYDNMDFERNVTENPVPSGLGQVDVFGETWDINMILKGNYWGRTIYTTDKICKLFLKWNLHQQKKYLEKKNALGFDYTWLILLVMGGAVALVVILFVLPQLGL